MTHVSVLLPLAVDKPFSYAVPEALRDRVEFGVRVEVEFGSARRYSGLVIGEVEDPGNSRTKPVLSVLDDEPIIHEGQIRFWAWMAEYYACTLGEVMIAALPSHLKLSSETRIEAGPRLHEAMPELDDDAYLIGEALSIRHVLTMDEVRKILQRKGIFPVLTPLLADGVVRFQEELQERFRPRLVTGVRLHPRIALDRDHQLPEVLQDLVRAGKQLEGLMAYLQLESEGSWVRKSDLLARAAIQEGILRALVQKEILETYPQPVSRLGTGPGEDAAAWTLSPYQEACAQELEAQLRVHPTVLLEGITGSGKTLLYARKIRELTGTGKQVLYLLPEIALTTQLISRVEQLTGRQVLTYHSRLNPQERVEIWRAVLRQPDIIVLGPRSGLFLPFFNLGLIIVDEEHDSSFKQQDPAPRYQGRDAAIMLAHLSGAKTILGSATPSLESYAQAQIGKYGHIRLTERYGEAKLPEIRLINLRQETVNGNQAPFSTSLLTAMKETLGRKEQVLLFQNRRGYAPALECGICQWVQPCIHCDVSLTYHKPTHKMHCHYCGFQSSIPTHCPQCGNRQLTLKGFGTQRIEDDLKIFFPDARIERLDLDTARSRQNLARILDDFSHRRIDILVGTQMITKGLDFGHLALVGILQADQLLAYPDFRASERAFQLMVQVAGRAGRKDAHGRVLIQTYDPANPLFQDVRHMDLPAFYRREMAERKTLGYPPYGRMIRILLKHRDERKLEWAAVHLVSQLQARVGDRVQGPATPSVARINNYFLRTVQMKIPGQPSGLRRIKEDLLAITAALRTAKGMSGLIVLPDVDPM